MHKHLFLRLLLGNYLKTGQPQHQSLLIICNPVITEYLKNRKIAIKYVHPTNNRSLVRNFSSIRDLCLNNHRHSSCSNTKVLLLRYKNSFKNIVKLPSILAILKQIMHQYSTGNTVNAAVKTIAMI